MKELLLQYAQYNAWANKPIIDLLLSLEDGTVDKVIPSSFPSLRRTVLHIWSAESVWLQRMEHAEHPLWEEDGFTGTFGEICNRWEQTSANLVKFAANHDDETLHEMLPFIDRQGHPHIMPVYQLLHHSFDHSTYHRGQITSMLRQLGMTDLPQTDFTLFARQR